MRLNLGPRLSNQSGFGVTEILVTAGVMAVMIGGFAQYFGQSLKSLKRVEMKGDLVSLRSDMRMMLASRDGCTAVFGTTQTLNTGNPQITLNYDSTNTFRSEPGAAKSASSLLQDIDVRAERVYLDEIRDLGASPTPGYRNYAVRVMTSFVATMDVGGPGAFAPMNMGSVVLNVRNGSNQIEGCSSGSEGENVALLCESMGGQYNAATDTCDYNNLRQQVRAAMCRSSGGNYNYSTWGCTPTGNSVATICSSMGGSYSGGRCHLQTSAQIVNRFRNQGCGRDSILMGFTNSGSPRCEGAGYSGGGDH